MPTRRSYSGVAPATRVTTDLPSGGTSFVVLDGTGYPDGTGGPFFVLVDRGLPSEEKILIGSRSGNTFTVAASGRGQDGTIASAHSAESTVEHTVTAIDLDEMNAHTADAGGDPHPQYLSAGGKAADSNLLDGIDSSGFVKFGQKASDSELLDGIDSSGFVRPAAGGSKIFSTSPTVTSNSEGQVRVGFTGLASLSAVTVSLDMTGSDTTSGLGGTAIGYLRILQADATGVTVQSVIKDGSDIRAFGTFRVHVIAVGS